MKKAPADLDGAPILARLAPLLAVLVAIAAQSAIRDPLVLGPNFRASIVESILVVTLIVCERFLDTSPVRLHLLRYALGFVLAASATSSTVLLVDDLIDAKPIGVDQLLLDGASILVVAVVGFSVLFWQLDRGGPDGRVRNQTDGLAFWFTQDGIREYSDQFERWQPRYLDYLYLSSTNVTAFSPTDTMPLTRTAKMLMLWESVLALTAIGLIFARAINILS